MAELSHEDALGVQEEITPSIFTRIQSQLVFLGHLFKLVNSRVSAVSTCVLGCIVI